MRIMVIDDDVILLKALQNALEQNDHEVVCFSDAGDAVEDLKDTDYDFLLVD